MNTQTAYDGIPRVRNRRRTFKYWVWTISLSALEILIGVSTDFIGRCRENKVFRSFPFAISIASAFIYGLAGARLLARNVGPHRIKRAWRNDRKLFIVIISLAFSFIVFFSIAIYPAYKEATIAISAMTMLLFFNVSSIIVST